MSIHDRSDADSDALRRVAADGNDMSKPMDIDFQVTASNEAAAARVAVEAARLGYRTALFCQDEPVANPDAPWTCECTRSMVATHDAIVAAQADLDLVSRPLGAYADGWSTFGNVDSPVPADRFVRRRTRHAMSAECTEEHRHPQFTLRDLFVLVAVVALLLGISIPAIHGARDRARRTQCQKNFRQLALGLYNYQDRTKFFPPAYTADANGEPMLSWRAIVAPYVEQSDGWCIYDDQPGDSPANRVGTAMPWPVHQCPADSSVGRIEANDFMIVGPGMLSDGKSSTTIPQIIDGLSNTIMFVEATGAKIPWAAPGDLETGKITFKINEPRTLGVSSEHPGGANCAFCDGSVAFMPDSIDPAVVRAMCTISGGEKAER